MKVVVFAIVRDSGCLDVVRRAVDSIEVPGCATGWCRVDELLYGAHGLQIRIEVPLFFVRRRERKEKEEYVRGRIVGICKKYVY